MVVVVATLFINTYATLIAARLPDLVLMMMARWLMVHGMRCRRRCGHQLLLLMLLLLYMMRMHAGQMVVYHRRLLLA